MYPLRVLQHYLSKPTKYAIYYLCCFLCSAVISSAFMGCSGKSNNAKEVSLHGNVISQNDTQEQVPVVALWTDNLGDMWPPYFGLLYFACWPDGMVIFAEKTVNYDRAIYVGFVTAKSIEDLLLDFENTGLFETETAEMRNGLGHISTLAVQWQGIMHYVSVDFAAHLWNHRGLERFSDEYQVTVKLWNKCFSIIDNFELPSDYQPLTVNTYGTESVRGYNLKNSMMTPWVHRRNTASD